MGKSSINGPFSIAMLNCQRVCGVDKKKGLPPPTSSMSYPKRRTGRDNERMSRIKKKTAEVSIATFGWVKIC